MPSPVAFHPQRLARVRAARGLRSGPVAGTGRPRAPVRPPPRSPSSLGERDSGGATPTSIRLRPQIRRDYPLNLSILLSGGKETNQDSLSSGERRGKSPAPNPRPTGGRGKCGVRKTSCPVSIGGLSPSDRGSARGRCEAGNGSRRAGVRKGSGRRWHAVSAACFTATPRPDLAASRGRGTSARCALSAHEAGTGPPAPGATVNRGGLSSVRPDRVASPRAGTGPRTQASGVCGDVGNPPDPS
ncbi:unnamed protein product [Knipowitschia caucasica]